MLRARFYHGAKFRLSLILTPWNLVGECLPQTLHYVIKDSMTEAMLSLQNSIMLSYDPRPKDPGFMLSIINTVSQ